MIFKTTIFPAKYCFKNLFLASVALLLPAGISAQSDTIQYDLSVSSLASTGDYSPFWMQSDQYGKISSAPTSALFMAGINKDYLKKRKLVDYGFKANILLRTDKSNSTAYFHEFYAKARFWIFDMFAGSKEQIIGNQDSTLSCGGLLFSKNARPIPQVHAGIDRFTTVPFTFGMLAIKGGLSHGWFTDNIYTEGMLFHHKNLYLKLGGELPVNIQYGLDHFAEWGGRTPEYGQLPTGLSNFKSIFFGKSGGTGGEAINVLGNHILSQSTRMDIRIKAYDISAYWQNISEDSPRRFLGTSPNAADGLWGIAVRNKNLPIVKGILYEYLNTSDQNGPYHDKDGVVYGGNDGYFINYVYQNGWSHYSRIIGTPFISSALYNNDKTIYSTMNNRVIAHHFGLEGDICGWNYRTLASFSKNYGTYSVPINISNTSVLLEARKRFQKLSNIEIGWAAGADFGKLYGNSVGCQISVRKVGNLFHY